MYYESNLLRQMPTAEIELLPAISTWITISSIDLLIYLISLLPRPCIDLQLRFVHRKRRYQNETTATSLSPQLSIPALEKPRLVTKIMHY
jgi:hypothetical protein